MDLTKDQAILQILVHLEQRFGKDSFHIEDYWDADLCAIGLADRSGKHLMYVSSFGKTNDTFHVEVEEKNKSSNSEQATIIFGDLTRHELEEVFSQHFLI